MQDYRGNTLGQILAAPAGSLLGQKENAVPHESLTAVLAISLEILERLEGRIDGMMRRLHEGPQPAPVCAAPHPSVGTLELGNQIRNSATRLEKAIMDLDMKL